MNRFHPRSRAHLRVVFLFGFSFGLLHGIPNTVIARQATPAATPGPATCDVAPRSAAELVALLGPSPNGEQALEPQRLPPGSPADAATTEAITAVVRELEACFNAGDMLRVYALFSDDQFRQMPNTEEIVAELTALDTTTPTPAPTGRGQVLTGPWHVEVLDDGRALAAVSFGFEDEVDYPSSTKALLFDFQDGRWLIQEMLDLVWLEGEAGPIPVEDVVGPPPGA